MYSLPEPTWVEFTEDAMSVALDDGRIVSVPIAWYPRLLHATRDELKAYELSPAGIHWDALDEDISVEGILKGFGDISRAKPRAA